MKTNIFAHKKTKQKRVKDEFFMSPASITIPKV